MYFHIVDSELVGVFDLSNRIYIESVKTLRNKFHNKCSRQMAWNNI